MSRSIWRDSRLDLSGGWSQSPQEIISHHYRLHQRQSAIIDTSPPFCMFNSPKSIHYIPRRASSADAINRIKSRCPPSRSPSHQFSPISEDGKMHKSLRLPLGPVVSSVLLQSRHYQPPRRRSPVRIEQVPVRSHSHTTFPSSSLYIHNKKDSRRPSLPVKAREIEMSLQFKNELFTRIIDRGLFSDHVIRESIEVEGRKWIGRIAEDSLEMLKEEVYMELGINDRVEDNLRSPFSDMSTIDRELRGINTRIGRKNSSKSGGSIDSSLPSSSSQSSPSSSSSSPSDSSSFSPLQSPSSNFYD
ncbi:hypothetical protein PRIPAC_74378 [Pristionchus pacificus]|uniref:Uncharacterized protein n=1 Tax=Pristionchus pacificus TaxID=54126 RepID=A0A2A6CRR7_PRIPA|nr:hypothetical protein PRIPAC_74378 [Pristionchus pacificus]|eukprot:PDM80721.1 hypothetical protein PRIPAC_35724 [Pristionchus pacificus]